MEWIWILLGVMVLVIVLVVVATAVLFRFAIGRPAPVTTETVKKIKSSVWHKHLDEMLPILERVQKRPKEELTIRGYDGTELHATYIPTAEPSDRFAILVHGWHGNRYWDFGMALESYLDDEKCNLLMIEQRAHDSSPCRYTGFGWYERHDVRSWAEYAVGRFGKQIRIVVSGVSMGARTVLLASELEMPNVLGVTSDCAPSSAWEEFRHVLHSYHLPAFPFLPLADLMCRVFAGYSFKEGNTVESVTRAKYPILFIHGKKDDFVPCEMTEQCYEACTTKKTIILVEEAGHGESFPLEKDRVCAQMHQFFEEIGL